SALPDGCVLHRSLTVMDMVYRPLRTRLLRDAQAASARPIDGLWMLVFQGLAQLELWTGVVPPEGTAEALHAHLAEAGRAAAGAPPRLRGRAPRRGAPRSRGGPPRGLAPHRRAD